MTLTNTATTPMTSMAGSPTTSTGATNGKKQAPASRGTTNNGNQNYSLIKAASEGGSKRMLDVIFERLRYTIRSEWATGQEVAEILESFEDVELTPPDRLTDDEKDDDLLVEMWKEDVKQHVSEKRALTKAKRKLYSTVWKMMSKVLQGKVSGQNDFTENNTRQDVVWLVNTIRALVTEFDNTAPEFLSVSEALEKIVTFRQHENMDNADYVKDLMALIKVYEQYCGPYGVHIIEFKRIITQVAEAVDEQGNPFGEEVQSAAKSAMIKETREKAIALQIIRGACKKRYSSLKKNLATDYGLKIDKYPSTIDGAVNALNVAESQLPPFLKKQRTPPSHNLQFVQANAEQKIVPGTNGKTVDHITCHKCKAVGHYATNCPATEESSSHDERKSQPP
mmetsp:Transcript_14501/g.27283  ORF Transcript_14501/g.27283 Transcript_14501/m.27283 type:complete len:394 (+) Transcript_14501:52-1233(+)|eukprot:CAMPEP_0176485602 /NCGR_PEP_ID=MMETSP0200_2-20121128/5124_1 /TAXON_ID=947934 /ORGANISM="Chaetoceros sp., Strain GSL56" /LENGTH=393 /DNA_ID=CAMNT_0017882251 /DNA_START=108 /DNA_END=1289 /DNA_ORIENTATION=-